MELFAKPVAQPRTHIKQSIESTREKTVCAFAQIWKSFELSSMKRDMDIENGFLLTPSIDHLFDRGFISFEDNGELIVSNVAHKESVRRMGVDTEHVVRVGRFSEGQKFFLGHHRRAVFLQARSTNS